MGESRSNPLSPAYRGELPKVMLGGTVRVAVEASAEFMMRLQAWRDDPVNAGKDGPEPKEADTDCVFYLVGSLVRPSHLFRDDRSKWPAGEAKMGEIFRLPYLEFVQRIELDNPHMRAATEPAPEVTDA